MPETWTMIAAPMRCGPQTRFAAPTLPGEPMADLADVERVLAGEVQALRELCAAGRVRW